MLNAHDAGENPALWATILSLWNLTSLDELVRHANGSPSPDFSRLFPAILAAAEDPRPSGAWTGHSDPVARNVLEWAGMELSVLAKNVIRRLFRKEASVPVAMSGGVFRQSERVRQVFYNKLRAEFPQASVNPTVVEAVQGAIQLARK